MLTADILKPHLLHEDREIRNAVVEYFVDSWSQDAEILPMILTACDRYGHIQSLSLLSRSYRFSITESAFDEVLRHIDKVDDPIVMVHLSRIISNAPLDYLRNNESAIQGLDGGHRNFQARIQSRLNFGSWTGERLWEELQAFSDRCEDAQYANEIDHTFADALIEALARHNIPDAETVRRLLTDPEVEETWLEIFLVDLAGQRRITEAIPALVDKFHIDTDYMLERCSNSLSMMQSVRVIHLIKEAFPSAPWNFRNYTSSVLAHIKHPDAEEAIIDLLEEEADLGFRTKLCYGLCKLFSERGVKIVHQQFLAGYEEMMVCLEGALLPVIDILGISLPEADQWRAEREERKVYQAERREELDEIGRQYAASTQQKSNQSDGFIVGIQDKIDKPIPYQRHDSKIGRNEPCPCGSSKKYKRCCGR